MPKISNLPLFLDVTPYWKIEFFCFPLCLTPPLPYLQTTYWKKVSLIAFRQTLPNILPVVNILSLTITSYLKKLSSWLISLNGTPLCPQSYQNYPPPLILLFVPTSYELPCSFSLAFVGDLVDGQRILPITQKLLITRTRKILLTKFSSNHPIQTSFIAVGIAIVWYFFNFTIYALMYHAKFD